MKHLCDTCKGCSCKSKKENGYVEYCVGYKQIKKGGEKMKKITINGITGLSKVEFGGTYITKAFYNRLTKAGAELTIVEDDCYIDGKDCVQIN